MCRSHVFCHMVHCVTTAAVACKHVHQPLCSLCQSMLQAFAVWSLKSVRRGSEAWLPAYTLQHNELLVVNAACFTLPNSWAQTTPV